MGKELAIEYRRRISDRRRMEKFGSQLEKFTSARDKEREPTISDRLYSKEREVKQASDAAVEDGHEEKKEVCNNQWRRHMEKKKNIVSYHYVRQTSI